MHLHVAWDCGMGASIGRMHVPCTEDESVGGWESTGLDSLNESVASLGDCCHCSGCMQLWGSLLQDGHTGSWRLQSQVASGELDGDEPGRCGWALYC